MSATYDVAIAGATGAVGEALLQILEARDFPVGRLFPLASERSAGRTVQFRGKAVEVGVLDDFDFRQVAVGLFSAGASISAWAAPRAAAAGAVVVDNTSQFRYDDDIPLVVPECNPHRIADHTNHGIIANPNCSTIQMVVALKPINDAVGIERVNVSTYQSVSGAGRLSMESLTAQSRAILGGSEVEPQSNHEKPVAFNVVPKIDRLMDNGYTREEMKMVWETRKILEEPDILVNPTCVRVPVYLGHSEALHIETLRQTYGRRGARIASLRRPGWWSWMAINQGDYPTAVDRSRQPGRGIRRAHPRGPLASAGHQHVGGLGQSCARALH